MKMIPGRCNKITFNDGTSEVFHLKGVNSSSGLQDVEVPPGSGKTDTFEHRYPGALESVEEVACP